MRNLRWSEALAQAQAGELAEIEAQIIFDEEPIGGQARLFGRAGSQQVEIWANQDAPGEVPEWALPPEEHGWSLADAEWLARLLHGQDPNVWTAKARESALDDLQVALARLHHAERALPGIQDPELKRAVASLRLALAEGERAEEFIQATEPREDYS